MPDRAFSYQVNDQTLTDPFSTPAPELLALAERYPACFDWEHPKPLRINVPKQLIRAGHDQAVVKRALVTYCTAPVNFRQNGAISISA
jgi:hypothetical protein